MRLEVEKGQKSREKIARNSHSWVRMPVKGRLFARKKAPEGSARFRFAPRHSFSTPSGMEASQMSVTDDLEECAGKAVEMFSIIFPQVYRYLHLPG